MYASVKHGLLKEIWYIWLNKTRILPSCICASTIAWLHHFDSYEMPREKAIEELKKDAVSVFEHILEGVSYKVAVVWPLKSHLETIKVSRSWYPGSSWRYKDKQEAFSYGTVHIDVSVFAD